MKMYLLLFKIGKRFKDNLKIKVVMYAFFFFFFQLFFLIFSLLKCRVQASLEKKILKNVGLKLFQYSVKVFFLLKAKCSSLQNSL